MSKHNPPAARTGCLIAAIALLVAGCAEVGGTSPPAQQSASAPAPAPPPPPPPPSKAASDASANAPAPAQFPTFRSPVIGAMDVRGRVAPAVVVEQWLTEPPQTQDRVLVVEFWATWCGPCRYSIPHLNQLASALARDVQVIGISNEPVGRIRPFMERNNMNYAVGTDPSQRMYAAMRIQGIPHAIVVSSDGVVRWQGHPLELTEQTLRQIVAADKAARGA